MSESQQVSTVKAWYEAGESLDFDKMLTYLTDDFVFEITGTKNHQLSRAQFEDHHRTNIMPHLKAGKTEFIDIIEGPGKVFVHAKSTAKLGELAVDTSTHDFQQIFYLTGDDKINRIKTQMDSSYHGVFQFEKLSTY